MTAVDTVRQLLRRAPGQPLCDACLADSCSATVAEMQEVTAELSGGDGFTKGESACWSCRQLTATTMYYVKCAHCSRRIGRDGLGVMFGGDQFHHQCWQRLLSDERVRISKSLSRESRRLIERSRAVLKGQPPRASEA